MPTALALLMVEVVVVYFIVLGAHALRRHVGLAHFYALIGGLTAVMSWVTDAGVAVSAGGVSFVVGSTVFYTSLLLSVFVVYVFDGPRAARIAIWTVAAVSALVPLVAATLHAHGELAGVSSLARIPVPSLRINVASVMTTIADLVFLAMAWELLGKPRWRMPLWLRAYLTLLGVMCVDVVLFNSGAFVGTPDFLRIMSGTLISRVVVSLFAFPFLYLYLLQQARKWGVTIPNRPVFAILREANGAGTEIALAQQEIARRKRLEHRMGELTDELGRAVSEVKILRGFLPICANCKKIRDDEGYWQQLEEYIQRHSDAVFSHGMCPECYVEFYGQRRPEDPSG